MLPAYIYICKYIFHASKIADERTSYAVACHSFPEKDNGYESVAWPLDWREGK